MRDPLHRDLTIRQLALLAVLCDEAADADRTTRAIATRLGVAKPIITRAMLTFERQGLAERRPDPRDRRSVMLFVTDEGRALRRRLGAVK